MCFTPAISLTTALLEFAIATFIIFKYKRSDLGKVIIVFIYVLGIYQFTEFMLCTTGNPIWPKIGFIAYTFLPALGVHFCYYYTKKKVPYWVYIIPVFFAVYVLFQPNFIISSTCSTYFIVIKHLLTGFLNWIHKIYYVGFILLSIILFRKKYKKLKNKKQKNIYKLLLIGLIFSLGPALLLLVIFPSLYIEFPSIYCEFAVLIAFCFWIAFHIESKK